MNSQYPLNQKSIKNAKAAMEFGRAVSHETRETILAIINTSPYCTVDHVIERLGNMGISMAQPNVSKHLKILYDAKVVEFKPNEENRRQSLYYINMEHLNKGMQMFEYFAPPTKKKG